MTRQGPPLPPRRAKGAPDQPRDDSGRWSSGGGGTHDHGSLNGPRPVVALTEHLINDHGRSDRSLAGVGARDLGTPDGVTFESTGVTSGGGNPEFAFTGPTDTIYAMVDRYDNGEPLRGRKSDAREYSDRIDALLKYSDTQERDNAGRFSRSGSGGSVGTPHSPIRLLSAVAAQNQLRHGDAPRWKITGDAKRAWLRGSGTDRRKAAVTRAGELQLGGGTIGAGPPLTQTYADIHEALHFGEAWVDSGVTDDGSGNGPGNKAKGTPDQPRDDSGRWSSEGASGPGPSTDFASGRAESKAALSSGANMHGYKLDEQGLHAEKRDGTYAVGVTIIGRFISVPESPTAAQKWTSDQFRVSGGLQGEGIVNKIGDFDTAKEAFAKAESKWTGWHKSQHAEVVDYNARIARASGGATDRREGFGDSW